MIIYYCKECEGFQHEKGDCPECGIELEKYKLVKVKQ